MSLHVIRTTEAGSDLLEAMLRLGRGDERRADRFLDAFESTVAKVAAMPGIGAPYLLRNPRLADLRRIPVRGFKLYQVFYLADDEYLEVVRVFHSSRNIRSILEREG